jgi:hypothetical protein
LNDPDVDALLQEMNGKAMPERVDGARLVEAGSTRNAAV